jgi:hypothetical protein
MLIYAENSHVIFKCEHCGCIERIEKQLKKRTFQGKLNKFYRQHDWHCQFEVERQVRKEIAVKETDKIIKMFSANVLAGGE